MFTKLLKIVEFIEKKLNNNYKLGSFLYIVIAIIAISIFIPSTLFTVSGGFLFSFPIALLYAIIFYIGSSTITFFVTRILLRDYLEEKIKENKSLGDLNSVLKSEKTFTQKDWLELVILTRISPVYPFNLINAFWAITQIDYPTYLIGTLIGVLPTTILEIYIGSLSHSLQEAHSSKNKVLLVLSIIFSLAISYFITKFVKNKVKDKINK
jgi:uncharacterized membrane protein YdjX (TVP38/TMEM64 family)